MAIQVATSSSLTFTKYRYDVFLSFRGEDTRKSFTVNLYDALHKKGIKAFIDDKKLGKGERIAPALLKAIERSRISIIVFSANYATSTWCLDELAHIVRCKNEKNQVVMPIFYRVDPSDVQYQRNSFGKAMGDHEDRFRDDLEKVRKWRSALLEAASLSSAWFFEDGCEFGFIERIVEDVYAMLPPKPYHNIEHMVGLEPRIEEVISLLNKSDKGVCMLGIHGTGGIGKTTLAKAIYNSIFYQFEGSCFLFDVNEASKKFQGIVHLQQKLLSEILEEKIMRFGSADQGISRIKHRLSHKRVLLVLDDVDEIEQLERLAGGCDWFGCGSKVIITTRNKQLLIAHNVKRTYELMELNDHDSLELFCWHAFHMTLPPKGYQHMSSHVISYAKGIPLALNLIGANLANKNLKEWRSTLEQYDRIPEGTMYEVLKISYDCLQKGAKIIFLDIACFFEEELSGSIDEIAEACDYGARFYIEVLIDKSLLSINDNDHFCMHDLIKQMAREIVRKEAPSDPGKRSRLWNYKDVLKVLHENSGSNNIEGIIFDPPQQEEVEWSGKAFEKMNNLRILIVRKAQFSTGPKYLPNNLRWLEWQGYPSIELPPNFSPNKLVVFKLCCSPFRLEEPFKAKREFCGMRITLPATTFPDWFHNWCGGGKMSFLARSYFPHLVFAFELGKANTSRIQSVHYFLSINGRVVQKRNDDITIRQGHVSLFNLGVAFEGEDWRWVQRFMELDWNDVEIQVIGLTPEIAVVKCGVYVCKQQIDMENIKFKSPIMLSMNAPITSLKRRAIASPPNEPPKKVLRKFKVADKGKINNTESFKEK